MKDQTIPPPSQNEWDNASPDILFYIILRIFFAVTLPELIAKILIVLSRIDLWLFPPLAFISAYITASNHFPTHPMKIHAVLSCAFMFATLTLFLIRPKRRKPQVHWVKNVE